MNRHVLVTLMLCGLAVMLFNIGGRGDEQGQGIGTGVGGLGSEEEETVPQAVVVAEGGIPAPEFSMFGFGLAVIIGLASYWFIRNREMNLLRSY